MEGEEERADSRPAMEKPEGYDDAVDEKRAPVKIILLGDSAVGKTKLVERFLMDNYHPQQMSTYALTLFNYEAEIEGRKVQVDFWDTAGQERFQSLHPAYYYQSHACILCFDITRKVTYTNMQKWYKELQEYRKGIPIIVIANKIDLDMSVTQKTFNFPAKKKLPFYFVSASDGTNVVKVFHEAITLGQRFKENPEEDFFNDVMSLIHDTGPLAS